MPVGYQVLTFSLTVAGTERITLVQRGSLQWVDVAGSQVDTLRFTIEDVTNSFTTAEWQEVILYIDGVAVFGGYVVKAQPTLVANGNHRAWALTCESYVTRLGRSPLIRGTWTNTSAGAIIAAAITAAGLTEFDTATYVAAGPTLTSFTASGEKLSALLDRLKALAAEAAGAAWDWQIRADKKLYFRADSADVAPFGLALATTADWSSDFPVLGLPTLNRDASLLYNRITVRGGSAPSAEITDNFTGDASTTLFTLSTRPVRDIVRITVAGTLQSYGVDWYDSFAGGGYNVLVNYTAGTLRFPDASPPAAAAAIVVVYRNDTAVVATAQDATSYAAYGNLWFDKEVSDPAITALADAQALADALLAQSAYGSVAGTTTVERFGIRAGQQVAVNFAALGVVGNYPVRKVTMSLTPGEFGIRATVNFGGQSDSLSAAVGGGVDQPPTWPRLSGETQQINVGSAGWIRGGQTAYHTGAGFFLGYSGGAYRFSIGNPAGAFLTWDGTTLTQNGTVMTGIGSGSELAIQSWQLTCGFSASDADTVAWTSGTLTFADGTAYSITAGNTGNMAARTYIYFDRAVSTTVLQVTTTPANAVGTGRCLLGSAINSTTEALYQIFNGTGGVQIGGSNIEPLSITANEIVAVTITGDKIAANTITAGHISVASLAAIQVDTGALNMSGNLTIGAAGGIYQGTGTAASPTTGLKIWNDGGVGRLATYNATVAQVYFGTDGKLYAGAGDVILDSNGLHIIDGRIDFLRSTTSYGTISADVGLRTENPTLKVYAAHATANRAVELYASRTSYDPAGFLAISTTTAAQASMWVGTGNSLVVTSTTTTSTQPIVAPAIRPAADSTTALQLQTASGTAVVKVDTTNGQLGVNCTPLNALHVFQAVSGPIIKLEGTLSAGAHSPAIYFKDDRGSGYASGQIAVIRDTSAGGDDLVISLAADNAAEVAGTLTERLRIKRGGEIAYAGNLTPYRNSTNYTGYVFVPLTTALTSTSWDGDAYSTTSKTVIDLSSVFSAPAGIKAILCYVGVRDSASVANDCWFRLGPTNADSVGMAVNADSGVDDRFTRANIVVPCDANGDVYYQCVASGSGTLDVVLQIHGYWI